MQRRDPRLFLLDIESDVEKIFRYSSGGESEFKSSELVQTPFLANRWSLAKQCSAYPRTYSNGQGVPANSK